MRIPGLPRAVAAYAVALAACAAEPCENLARIALAHTTVASAKAVAAGAFTPPAGRPISDLPGFCRVTGTIQPESDSRISFEVWLPASGWNGKFHGLGNGGFAGSIDFTALAAALRHGYAAAATDTGHSAAGLDAAWALGHPEKIVDFGYRAIHETAERAKEIIRAFYGASPKRSYFSSCSNGGRQALMEAQRFPADYDGILAGAPANYWTHLFSAFAWNAQTTPAGYIPSSKLPAIENAVLAACDAADGVKDGILNEPARCRFDPATLQCKGPETDACLSPAQVATLKKIYAGPRDGNGAPVMPGFSPGGETGAGGWMPWITGPAPDKAAQYLFAIQFFRNMVYSDPRWDLRDFKLDRDLKAADERLGHILNATEANLTPFYERGGKLILYHGWCDAAIPPQNAIDYYRSVAARMGKERTDRFVRLYMVPGMQHCAGGPGPDAFGQAARGGADARQDMRAALERWVEEGVAPGPIVATKYKSGADSASGIQRTRPLCPYPEVARWNGTGSSDDAANFTCSKPEER